MRSLRSAFPPPLAVYHSCQHLSLHDNTAIDGTHTFHARHRAPQLQYVHFEQNLVSRHDRPPPLHFVERHEVHDLGCRVLHHGHHENSTDLRHRLDQQYARHNRLPGKVSLKERLVDGHVLQAYNPLPRLELDDTVHEQKRISVREELQDLLNVDHCIAFAPLTVPQLSHERYVARMARPFGEHVTVQALAEERQVADDIADLVAHELVREA